MSQTETFLSRTDLLGMRLTAETISQAISRKLQLIEALAREEGYVISWPTLTISLEDAGEETRTIAGAISSWKLIEIAVDGVREDDEL